MVVDVAAAMRLRQVVALLALLALSLLPAFAHASPPDPVWLQGIYDDDDLDDVVTLAVSGAADLSAAPDELGRVAFLLALLQAWDDELIVVGPSDPARPRAPPSL